MEISANGAVNLAYAMQQANTQQQVQVSMFKKALDVQTQGALALLEALPSPVSSTQGLPANLGNNINVTA